MDFTNALLLGLLVFALVELEIRLFPVLDSNSRLKAAVVIANGQAAVFLVGATVWAHEQVIGNHPLTDLNVGSKIVAGIFLSAIALGINVAQKAVRNIGENEVQRPVVK